MATTTPNETSLPSLLKVGITAFESSDYPLAHTTFLSLSDALRASPLYSPNENMSDIHTTNLKYLLTNYYLGKIQPSRPPPLPPPATPNSDPKAPLPPPSMLTHRKKSLTASLLYLHSYLSLCAALSLDSTETLSDSTDLELIVRLMDSVGEDGEKGEVGMLLGTLSGRDAKVGRYNAIKAADVTIAKICALQSRRLRLNITADEEYEGADGDSLERDLWTTTLRGKYCDTVEEIVMNCKELEMLKMMNEPPPPPHKQPEGSRGPNVTTITRDSVGNLTFNYMDKISQTREQLHDGVFKPGWNLPTMTLEELGEIEYNECIEREARQAVSEEANKDKPQRYEYLVKHGKEDNAELVDASAKLDQDWDDWKDANPKGSGNKMADVGDRNF